MSPFKVTMDFETRSCAKLMGRSGIGAYKYSQDPTTQIMCLVYRFSTDAPGVTHLWHPEFEAAGLERCPDPLDLFKKIALGWLVEAHNAMFEKCHWRNILMKLFGWPDIPDRQWRCSAAKAAAAGYPRSLEQACIAVEAPIQKDVEGKKIMQKMTKPRRQTKLHPELRWFETKELFEGLFDYCQTDVLSEESLSERIPELSEFEQELWFVDQEINWRGFRCDPTLVEGAIRILEHIKARQIQTLCEMTEGAVPRATQRDKMKGWLEARGYDLPDMQGHTLKYFLEDEQPDELTRKAVELYQAANKTSTAKYPALKQRRCDDGRIHDALMFHGASTGRWSGKGFQPHNLPRNKMKPEPYERACMVIREGDLEWLEACYEKSMDVLSECIRGALVAEVGHEFLVEDFSAIETCVLFWEAGDLEGLANIRAGDDVYKHMATSIYGCEYAEVTDTQRQVGKVAILALGYGMGWKNFIAAVRKMAGIVIDDITAKHVVDTYRKEKHHLVKRLWYATEAAAMDAIRNPGEVFRVGHCAWQAVEDILYCWLPSGRPIRYNKPSIQPRMTPWGELKDAVHFWGPNDKGLWTLLNTYGGSAVESAVQGIARDLIAEAMVRVHRAGYNIVFHVHDELISEELIGTRVLQHFADIMSEKPAWVGDCPISTNGWAGSRYMKA